MTAHEFITVAKVGSIAEGSAETFVVGDNVVAVFITGRIPRHQRHVPPHGRFAGGRARRGWCCDLSLACLAFQDLRRHLV